MKQGSLDGRGPGLLLPATLARQGSTTPISLYLDFGMGQSLDLDSTICETYGLAKEGARHHGYTGARGYHPLLAIAAGTGEVLMSRLRDGRANTARGAAHFLRETVGRVRYGGARGQLTVRADSGFYAHTVVAACREMDVRFSITIRQRASLRDLIEAIPWLNAFCRVVDYPACATQGRSPAG